MILCNYYKISVYFLTLILIGGCTTELSTNTTSQENIEVISLKENFDVFEEIAYQWDEKAYLADVHIPVFLQAEDNPLWLISAGFQSPDKHTQSLLVNLNIDNTISIKRVTHATCVRQVDPVYPNDQLIDSSIALEYFENVNLVSALRAGESVSLSLEHVHPKDGEPVVWILSIFDVNPISSRYFFIDAFTGEELDIVR
jgi:hypothetical protein